ncbi:uncharacterized protein [Mytilus edulis]|uniref:uncharacterized protein n=1 Tax=Mytilus edulis TaxID=6550 RepID=UPI0039F072D1
MSFKFLREEGKTFKTPKAYFLPKIHKLSTETLEMYQNECMNKEKVHVPGRPIISQCSGPLLNIGKYLDYFLLPLVKTQATYLSDTSDFIRYIESTHTKQSDLLVSYDITSLYTNLNFNEINTAIENTLKDHVNQEYEIKRPSTESLLDILSILLTKNEFTFNENAYKQIVGVSMGGVASPEISDIAIFDHINNIIEQYPYKDNIKFHKTNER